MLNQRQNVFSNINKKRADANSKSKNEVLDEREETFGDIISKATRRGYDFTKNDNRIVSYDSDSMFLSGTENEQQNILEGGINEVKAQNQGWGWKASAMVGRALTKAGIEVAKMPGMVGGAIVAPFADEGEGWDTFVNNSWIKSMNELNETINEELLPVYVKKAVKEGNLMTNLTSIDFWATEGADGIGYIASMFAPGALIKSLNIGSKLTKFSSLSDKFLKAQKTLGVTPQAIDNFAITAANTIFEAGAEAGNAIDTFEKDLNNKLISGAISQETYDELIQQKGILGRDIFLTNVAILAGPNAINTKLLYGSSKANKLMNIRDKSGQIVDKASLSLLQRGGNAVKEFGKALGREGFFEEGLQSTTENYFKDQALEGELTDNYLNNISLKEFANEYNTMLTTTEGQKAIALGGILGGGMQIYQGAKQDTKNINETNRLLDLGKQVNDVLLATTINSDIYKRTEVINSETGEFEFELDRNGKKIIDPVKREELVKKAYNAETFSKIYDLAQELGDTEALEILQSNAESNFIMPFINNNDIGIEMMKEFLKENPNISQERKDIIIKKAEKIQEANNEFLDYGRDILNLKNTQNNKSDAALFYEKLKNVYNYKTGEELDTNSQLDMINENINKILADKNINENDILNNVDKSINKINNDIRYNKLKSKKEFLTKKLEKIQEEKNSVWDKNKQQKAFDEFINENNKIREKESEENIKKVDEIINKIDEAETIQEVDEALTGKLEAAEQAEEELDVDAEVNAIQNLINSAEKSKEVETTTSIDNETQRVINEKAESKKADILTNQNTEIEQQNNLVIQESVKEIDDKLAKVRNFESITIGNTVYNFDDMSFINGQYILTTEDKSDDKVFDSVDALVAYMENKLKVPKENTELKNSEEFETTEEEVIDQDPADKVILNNEYDNKDKSFPTIRTFGINRDGTKSSYIPEAFYNWLLRVFNNKKGTKVTFSKPTDFSYDPYQVRAFELFEEGDFSNMDFLIRSLPIQFNINDNTFGFIPTIGNIQMDSNNPEYIARENLVRAIIKNKSYDGISTIVTYQKGGQINYKKPEKVVDNEGNTIIKLLTNNISEFEQFNGDPQSIPLFFVMNKLGTVHDETNTISQEFNSTLTADQKGYVYTQLTAYNGSIAPIKLNVRKLNREQAELIYKVYKTLYEYNTNNNFKINQTTGTLELLYKQNPSLKGEIEKTFEKELNIFKSKNNILIGDLMNILIHDNLALDGSAKPYTTKFKGASISFGENSFVNFKQEVPEYKEALLGFLTEQKRQNIKLKFLANQNKNIDSKKYKEYLINEKVLSVNIDVNKPFTGDINVYLDSNIKTETKSQPEQNNAFGTNPNVQPNIETKKADIEASIELLNPEDIRRPNGSIGTQGFAPEQMKDLVSYLSDLLELNIPKELLDKSKEELKPLIEFIKNDKSIVDKIVEYVKTNPSEVSYLPDGTIQFEDGNHRANLLNIIGSEVIPVIEKTKLEEINAKYDAELAALENNSENIRNSETNPLSLQTKKPGLKFNLGTKKPTSPGLQNNPNKKC